MWDNVHKSTKKYTLYIYIYIFVNTKMFPDGGGVDLAISDV